MYLGRRDREVVYIYPHLLRRRDLVAAYVLG